MLLDLLAAPEFGLYAIAAMIASGVILLVIVVRAANR